MFESKSLKILLGNSIEEPEVDYDDAEVQSEVGLPVEEEALREYFYVSISDNIGKKDFKEEYNSVKNDIVRYSTKQKQVLAQSILKQIDKEYDFSPSLEVDTNSDSDLDEVYKFVEFIEFDHEDFIIAIWSVLNPDTNSLRLEKYCEQNQYKIISEIEEYVSGHELPWMIADFLRTYNKENIISWFCEKSKNLRSLILLNLIEGDENEW